MRIAIAGFSDETCTFRKDLTTVERFESGTIRGHAIIEKNTRHPHLRKWLPQGA